MNICDPSILWYIFCVAGVLAFVVISHVFRVRLPKCGICGRCEDCQNFNKEDKE